jgi:hypothetical protein
MHPHILQISRGRLVASWATISRQSRSLTSRLPEGQQTSGMRFPLPQSALAAY